MQSAILYARKTGVLGFHPPLPSDSEADLRQTGFNTRRPALDNGSNELRHSRHFVLAGKPVLFLCASPLFCGFARLCLQGAGNAASAARAFAHHLSSGPP